MDEYNLANALLDHEEMRTRVVDLDSFQKIPFAELTGLGGIIAELVPQFRTITETTNIPMDGLFRAINPKTGEVLQNLMYQSKQIDGAFVGALKHANGAFDQAAFVKVPGVKEVSTSVAAINPAALMVAAGIMAMSKKLDTLEEGQKSIMRFLERDKETSLQGDLDYLLEKFKKYPEDRDDQDVKRVLYSKTQDIEREAKHNIAFYQLSLREELIKKKKLISKRDVKKSMQKLVENFSNYRLAIYLYAFSSYLEIIYRDKIDECFLESISSTIRDETYKYAELYTIAYTELEDRAASSLESGAIKGAAVASRGLGRAIQKIPVVERGRMDEHLIAVGERLEEYKDESVEILLGQMRGMRNCQVKQFIDLIEIVNNLHNGEPVILLDNENVYVQLAC